jgi:hypothetical protein
VCSRRAFGSTNEHYAYDALDRLQSVTRQMAHTNVVSQAGVGLVNVPDGTFETLTLDTRQYDAGARVVATGAQGVAVDAFKTLYAITSCTGRDLMRTSPRTRSNPPQV